MAKASEQMEKALKVSECVPEIGTELHLESLLSKLLDEAVVDGDPQTILLFKGLVRAAARKTKERRARSANALGTRNVPLFAVA